MLINHYRCYSTPNELGFGLERPGIQIRHAWFDRDANIDGRILGIEK
jgi:hypothetical protein